MIVALHLCRNRGSWHWMGVEKLILLVVSSPRHPFVSFSVGAMLMAVLLYRAKEFPKKLA